MHYLDSHEEIQHRTGDFPLAHYYVDEGFSRYRMPTHWHKETEIVRVHSGSIRIYLDEGEQLLEAGDLLTIGSGVIHGGEPSSCVYECIVCDPSAMMPAIESCRNSLHPLLRHSIFVKSGQIASDPLLQEALDALFSTAARGLAESRLGMLAAMMNFLNRLLGSMDRARLHTSTERAWQRAEQLKPALEHIEQHYGQHISLETLAGLAGFSPKYFCRYFRTIVHRSPIDYLNYYRVECAAHFLLSSNMNVAEIAVLCGFADSSAFIKQFRKYKGTTPKQYKLRLGDGLRV